MTNFLITDINTQELLRNLQEKLILNNIFWTNEDTAKEIKRIIPHNGDTNIIFIIKDNKISWTNKKYGMSFSYDNFDKISAKDFIEG